MTELLTIALMWIALPSAVPPPIEQTEANCDAPVYASDSLICADIELRDEEQRISHLSAAFDGPASAWLEPQSAWFKRRAMCAFQQRHRACILEANAERVAVLTAAMDSPPEEAPKIRCAGAGPIESLTLVRRGQWLFAYEGDRLEWAAGRTGRHWTPYTSWEPGRRWIIHKLDGGSLDCQRES